MLRITTDEKNDLVVLKLEGRLAGPWVGILRDCWQRELARPDGQALRVDLRGVTFVDPPGRVLLAEMSRQNAQLVAGDCQMKGILAEIACPTDKTL